MINEKPEFSVLPLGEKAKHSVPFSKEWRLDLGDVIDAENDAVIVELSCTSRSNDIETSFVQLLVDETGFYYLNIEAGGTDESSIGSYEFEISLSDIAEETIYEIILDISTEEQIAEDTEIENLISAALNSSADDDQESKD